jgi:hypothetical protein
MIVYIATNSEDGRVYVGSTVHSVNSRRNDHLQKVKDGSELFFHQAIATHGPDNFVWEQIDTAGSTDELAQLEKKYILEFDSKSNGYNSDCGGGFRKTVYMYDVDSGELLETFDCLDDAAASIRADKKSISRACLNVSNRYGGFYWSYEYKEPYVPNSDARKKEVIQMDMEGNIIAEYKSVAEASHLTGANKSSIAKCCRKVNKSASGFSWKYKE